MRFLAILACTVLAGCSIFMHSIEQPQVHVRSGSVSSAGLGGISGQLQLDVTNPNDFSVPLSGMDWQLAIGGARMVSGTVQLSQQIPARGVAPVTTSLTITPLAAVNILKVIEGGTRAYQIHAVLHFSSGIGPVDVAIDYSGSIDPGSAGGVLGAL